MKVKKEELKNPVNVKTFPWCSPYMIYVKGSNYRTAVNIFKRLTDEKDGGGLGYNLAIEYAPDDNSKLIIFSEKEQKKEVSAEIKKMWGNNKTF